MCDAILHSSMHLTGHDETGCQRRRQDGARGADMLLRLSLRMLMLCCANFDTVSPTCRQLCSLNRARAMVHSKFSSCACMTLPAGDAKRTFLSALTNSVNAVFPFLCEVCVLCSPCHYYPWVTMM